MSHQDSNNPLVSVCINTYNQKKYIMDAVDGALKQKANFRYEILIGDDESTDGTKEICIEYAKKYPNKIRLLHNSRKDVIFINGRATGRANMKSLWHASKGKFLALCNGDDYWTDPYKLQRQVELLENNPKYAGSFHETQQVYEDGTIGKVYGQDVNSELSVEDTFSTLSPFHTSSFLFKNSIGSLPKWFDEIVSGDMALFSIVAAQGPLVKIPKIMSVYRKHEDGLTNSFNITQSYHTNRIKLIQFLNAFHNFKYDRKAKQVIAFHKRNQIKEQETAPKHMESSHLLTNNYVDNRAGDFADNFLNMALSPENMDLYYIRTSIKRALDRNLINFQGVFLDVGCGTMPYRGYIQKNSRVEKYVGLDIRNPDYQKENKPDLYWDGTHIELPENSIDSAMATEVLEHTPHIEVVLREIYRVLKPGGVFFLTVPYLWPLHDVPYDEYRYTPFSLKRHLRNCGFNDININALGGWNASMAQMLGLWIKRGPVPEGERKKISQQFFPLYKSLIESDNADVEFTSQSMFTGLYGTAIKV